MRFILHGGVTQNGTRILGQRDLQRLWNYETAYRDDEFTKPFWPISDTVDSYGMGYFAGHFRGKCMFVKNGFCVTCLATLRAHVIILVEIKMERFLDRPISVSINTVFECHPFSYRRQITPLL